MKMKIIGFLTVVSMMFLAGCQTTGDGFLYGFSDNAVSIDKSGQTVSWTNSEH